MSDHNYLTPTKSSLRRQFYQGSASTTSSTMFKTPTKSKGNAEQHDATPTSFSNKAAARGTSNNNSKKKNNNNNKKESDLSKTVFLIRHGESMGQAARRNGMDRRKDPRLLDAGLTEKGMNQAYQVPKLLGKEVVEGIQLVVSSPLTRALHTAVLAFPTKDEFLIHYGLAELGSRVPENTPREMKKVVNDIDISASRIDTSLEPIPWPPRPSDYTPATQKIKSIQRAFRHLYNEREEQTIAVICHFHIIQQALQDFSVRPQNACPFECRLYADGELELV